MNVMNGPERIGPERKGAGRKEPERNGLERFSAWMSRHLTWLVLIALVTALLLGYFEPALAVRTEFLGVWFVNLVKCFIPFIIFFTITSGIAGMSSLKKVGRIGAKALLYFEIVTTLSLGIGILLAYIIKPGQINKTGLPTQDASKYARQGAHGFDWGQFFRTNLTLQVLVLAVIVGIVVSLLRRREIILYWLGLASHFVFRVLRYVMYLAPL